MQCWSVQQRCREAWSRTKHITLFCAAFNVGKWNGIVVRLGPYLEEEGEGDA